MGDSYYLAGASQDRTELKQLFRLLDDDKISAVERFVASREIADSYLRRREFGKLVSFLGGYVNSHADDPYNAYHLFTMAYAYSSVGSAPMAAIYYDRIIKNYPDLVLKGESIHLLCLKNLLETVNSPERRVDYRRELISRFQDSIDMGQALFLLAKDYELLGEWNLAIQTYQKFLPYFGASIPGYPEPLTYARNVIDFANSQKDWTFETLDELVLAVKEALVSGSASKLTRLRAKVNFFAMSWHQDLNDGVSRVVFDLAPFMGGSLIQFSPTLESNSNSREGFLKTWGWADRGVNWTFYFRKINFPADPEIHGRWEWAGIYYGDRLE